MQLMRPAKRSSRFLKKAAQKRLLIWACGAETSAAQFKRVFLLLFVHKKKPSSSRLTRQGAWG
jgi:hypothetical protein